MTAPEPTSTEPTSWTPAPAHEPSHLRRNVLVGMSTLSALVLAVGYQKSLETQSVAAPSSISASGSSGKAASPNGPAGSAAANGALKDGTYTGSASATRWGDVQVRIVVSGGRITSSNAVAYPNENPKDAQINARAVPTYNAAAVAVQSAQIDAVSGATVTWQGYTDSLQSAIDQARA